MKSVKKVGVIILGALMACTLAFSLMGCANDEQVIRDGLTEDLNEFNDPNSLLWKELITSSGSDLSDIGLGSQDLISAWTEGFSFEVGEITVDGDKADVAITITCKQLGTAVTTATEKIMSESASFENMTEEEITKKMGETILDELKQSSPVTTDITIHCTKTGNEWNIDEDATSEYARALAGS
jgi:hypothetical protein